MSTDFYLVSETEMIHVAQDGMSGFSFYSRESDCMLKLRDFLERNQGKTLRFLPEQIAYDLEDEGIIEIEWKANRDAI